MLMSYVSFFVFAVICAVFYWILIKLEFYKHKRFAESELSKDKIFCNSIQLAITVEQMQRQKRFEKSPHIKAYLDQSNIVSSRGVDSIQSLKVCPVKSVDGLKERLLSELRNVDADIWDAVQVQSKICHAIWKLKSPIICLLSDLKVNFMLFFLKLLLTVLNSSAKQVSEDRAREIKEEQFVIPVEKSRCILSC